MCGAPAAGACSSSRACTPTPLPNAAGRDTTGPARRTDHPARRSPAPATGREGFGAADRQGIPVDVGARAGGIQDAVLGADAFRRSGHGGAGNRHQTASEASEASDVRHPQIPRCMPGAGRWPGDRRRCVCAADRDALALKAPGCRAARRACQVRPRGGGGRRGRRTGDFVPVRAWRIAGPGAPGAGDGSVRGSRVPPWTWRPPGHRPAPPP